MHASRKFLTGSSETVQIGALRIMLDANNKLGEAIIIPELMRDLETIKKHVGMI